MSLLLQRRRWACMLAAAWLPDGLQALEPGTDLAGVWRKQGGVLMIRHTSTESGLGDPPGFVLGQCQTQRNLSPQGQQEARAIQSWMQTHQFKPEGVFSSQWCRCQDTARLAFGPFTDWPALNSTFGGQGQAAEQERQLRQRLMQLPENAMEVWVTHQVNMTGLTGAYPAMGEGFVIDRRGQLLARGKMLG